MTTYRFQEVRHTVRRRVACSGGCGKKLSRQTTFSQTINPFNRTADGRPKTYGEICKELVAEGNQWEPVATCPACRPGGGGS